MKAIKVYADGPLQAFAKLYNKTAPIDLARVVYGDEVDEGYLEEKAEQIKRDVVGWISSLDYNSLERLEKWLQAGWDRGGS